MTQDPDDFEKRLAAIEKKLGLGETGALNIGNGGISVTPGARITSTGGNITVGYVGKYVEPTAVPRSDKTTAVLLCPHCTKPVTVAAEREQQWTRLTITKPTGY